MVVNTVDGWVGGLFAELYARTRAVLPQNAAGKMRCYVHRVFSRSRRKTAAMKATRFPDERFDFCADALGKTTRRCFAFCGTKCSVTTCGVHE